VSQYSVRSQEGANLVGRGSRMINRLSEAIGDAQPIVSLRLKSRRAVVYRGPRLGASTGLAHHLLGVRAV
jgi:hypothetical protein